MVGNNFPNALCPSQHNESVVSEGWIDVLCRRCLNTGQHRDGCVLPWAGAESGLAALDLVALSCVEVKPRPSEPHKIPALESQVVRLRVCALRQLVVVGLEHARDCAVCGLPRWRHTEGGHLRHRH